MFCERTKVENSEHFIKCLNKAFDSNEEGVVIKRADSRYSPGQRENGGWYKIKPDVSLKIHLIRFGKTLFYTNQMRIFYTIFFACFCFRSMRVIWLMISICWLLVLITTKRVATSTNFCWAFSRRMITRTILEYFILVAKQPAVWATEKRTKFVKNCDHIGRRSMLAKMAVKKYAPPIARLNWVEPLRISGSIQNNQLLWRLWPPIW